MPTSVEQTADRRRHDETAAAHGELHSLSLLCAAAIEPAWTNLSLQLDAHGCHETRLRWVSTVVELLAALRDETYDCLLIADGAATDCFDGLDVLRAVRAGGYGDPAVLLTSRMTDDRWLAALQLHCSVLTSTRGWESRALVPMLRGEMQRSELRRDNYRLSLAQHRRLLRERDETEHLLDQQRQILRELRGLVELPGECDSDNGRPGLEGGETPADRDAGAVGVHASARVPEARPGQDDTLKRELQRPGHPVPPPDVLSRDEVLQFYDEMLRTYVMMGSGRLSSEITRLAELLAAARVSPRDALGMHLQRVETLVRGLGSRSSRHVLSRADLLALELTIQLGECYRRGGPRA
jgi:hypothetical protein